MHNRSGRDNTFHHVLWSTISKPAWTLKHQFSVDAIMDGIGNFMNCLWQCLTITLNMVKLTSNEVLFLTVETHTVL